MTWNISFSLVTGIVLCILVGYYVAYPKLPIVLNKFFVAVAVSEMLTLSVDVISSMMDMDYQAFPLWILYAVNLCYFILFAIRDFSMLAYTAVLVSHRKRLARGYHVFGRSLFAAFLLLYASTCFNGLIFSIDGEGYHNGPWYYVTEIQVFLFLILGVCLLIRNKDELRERTFIGMMLIYAILTAGAVVRGLHPEYLLLDTFYMIAVMILYISQHNADLFRESRTLSFDYQAFEQVIREHHSYGIWYQLIGVMPHNYEESRQIYGGLQMDEALSGIGRFLRESFRKGTIFYERSGCFLVMVDGREEGQDAVSRILPDVIRRMREPWDAGEDARIFLNFVFGQMNSDLGLTSVNLELEAIRRLLEKGGNGELDHDFVVDRLMIDEVAREFAVKKALSHALQENEIQVYMQPIIEAKTGRVVGAEALSRLIDPEMGLVPPGEFIPLAERSGSIIQIGDQVLSKTCRFLVEQKEALSGLEFININLSPIQCMDHDLAKTFEMVPRAYGVDPKKLHLEITEESMVDPEVLKSQMDVLGLLGYAFALDDYGSGYANQFRIKTFPFNGIKLDMKIVWAHFRDPDAILPNAVSSFLDRGLSVTAEGVETAEMAEALTKMGCTYLQGFYYSRPLPMDEFVKYVEAHTSIPLR